MVISIFFPVYEGTQRNARRTQIGNALVSATAAIHYYHSEYHRWPLNLDELIKNPRGIMFIEPRAAHLLDTPLIRFLPIDATHSTGTITHAGEDGVFDTDDDIEAFFGPTE